MSKSVNMEFLHHWLFHYNPYKKLWYAFKRDKKEDYFNGKLSPEETICAEKHSDIVKYLTLLEKGVVIGD